MNDKPNDLTICRVIKAPRATVWRAWTQPEHFEKWWAPTPLKTRVIEMQVKNGGSFHTAMTMPDGNTHPSHGCFLEVIPEQRIVFTDALSGGWRPNKETFMTAIIGLTDHEDGTEYNARILHSSAADCKKHEEMGFFDGWGTCLKQLSEVAEAL